jgi:hypothetical protein
VLQALTRGRPLVTEKETGAKREQRSGGVLLDLERLQAQAERLYLVRFVDAVRQARGEYGRYLLLRAGDELAIRVAGDGSSELLNEIIVSDEEA